MVPKVDTFAKDISEEIKRKEASVTDIATASNDIGNSPEEPSPFENKSSKIFFIAIGFFTLGILALIAFIYYYVSVLSIPEDQAPLTQTSVVNNKATSLSTLSVVLNDNIGRHVSSLEKREKGYVLTLSSYPAVFAYITRKESDYISELIDAVSTKKPTAQNNTPKIQPNSFSATTSTSSALATPASSSLTIASQASSSEITLVDSTSSWSNVTLSNVNIRIFNDGERSVAYSFISTEKLIIAATAEDILTIKNAILR